MTASMFLTLFTVFSAITSLVTEGVKNVLDSCNVKYASNIVALIVAMIVGTGGTAIYFVYANFAFTNLNIITMILMGFASSVGATVGYDKVLQTITQWGELKNN